MASSQRAVVWRNGVPVLLPLAPGDPSNDAVSINDSGVILGHTNQTITKRLAVWEDDRLAWVDEGRIPSYVLYHWNGISNAGVGYASYNLAGDTVYVWDNGQLRTIASAVAEPVRVDDVSSDGLLVGRIGATSGVWTADEVVHPWDITQVDKCTQIAEDRYVVCVRAGV
jgi:hypothetical protein